MSTKQSTWDPPVDVIDALDAALDAATARHYDPHADETLVECRCCGEWEGHRDECPMPAIARWMALPLNGDGR